MCCTIENKLYLQKSKLVAIRFGGMRISEMKTLKKFKHGK